MNEFVVKKLGEVIAFARVGNETIDKAKKSFSEFLSDKDLEETKSKSLVHIDGINLFVKDKNVSEALESEAQKTAEKISSMRDLYIGSEWENPSEVFEWWGFFGGSAIAHWNLVKGIAEELADDKLVQLSYEAIAYHENLYNTSMSVLAEIGRKEVKVI